MLNLCRAALLHNYLKTLSFTRFIGIGFRQKLNEAFNWLSIKIIIFYGCYLLINLISGTRIKRSSLFTIELKCFFSIDYFFVR